MTGLPMTPTTQDDSGSARAELEAHERWVALATLATGVAHEINNPLATVLGNIELALDELDHGALNTISLRELLVDAREGAGRVREIVQNMMLIARGDVAPSLPCPSGPAHGCSSSTMSAGSARS